MSGSTQLAQLTYNAADRRLFGSIGNSSFSMLAESGGGRGRLHGHAETSLESHLATTREIKAKGQRGGTLPPGKYACVYVEQHHKFHECIQLFMAEETKLIRSPFASMPIAHHRTDEFFIHGRGERGSDGCIVPLNPNERLKLTRAIRDFSGSVILTVAGVGYSLPAENFGGIRC